MHSSGNIFGVMGFIIAITCLYELKKTKKILSKYVNEEDKILLLTKEKPGKRLYIALGIWLIIFIGLVSFLLLKK